MKYKDKNSTYTLSRADTLRFRSIVIDVMSEAASIDASDEGGGIGTLGEKQMHAAIKRFICPDPSFHEIKLDTADSGEKKRRKFVADILKDGIAAVISDDHRAFFEENVGITEAVIMRSAIESTPELLAQDPLVVNAQNFWRFAFSKSFRVATRMFALGYRRRNSEAHCSVR